MPGRADKTHAHLHSLLSTGILVHIAVVSGILPGVHPLNASHQHGHSCKRAAGIPCGSFLFLFPASTSFSNPAHERHDRAVEHRAANTRQYEQQADRPDIQQVRPVQADGDEQRHCRQDAQHRARDLSARVARRKRRPALAYHAGHAAGRLKRFALQKGICFHLRGTRDEHRHRGRHEHQQHAQADARRRIFRNSRARPGPVPARRALLLISNRS